MLKPLFAVPVHVTAGQFDDQLRLRPTRIEWAGNEVEFVDSGVRVRRGENETITLFDGRVYYCLERLATQWRLLGTVT
jgi:hypothetical protein